MLPNSVYDLDGEAKVLDAQSHKLKVNNSVVSVQTVLCVHCTIKLVCLPALHLLFDFQTNICQLHQSSVQANAVQHH